MNGFPGAAGAIDCVHVPWGRCPTGLKGTCTGKEGFPTVSYEVTCNMCMRMTHCESGFAGTINDKTISRVDYMVEQVRNPGSALFCACVRAPRPSAPAMHVQDMRVTSGSFETTAECTMQCMGSVALI